MRRRAACKPFQIQPSPLKVQYGNKQADEHKLDSLPSEGATFSTLSAAVTLILFLDIYDVKI